MLSDTSASLPFLCSIQPALSSPCLYSWHCQQLTAHQASVSWFRLHNVWDQEQLHTHCFSLCLVFFLFVFLGGRGQGGWVLFWGFCLCCFFFFLVLLSSPLQTQIALLVMCLFSFIVVLISYSSRNLYIGD